MNIKKFLKSIIVCCIIIAIVNKSIINIYAITAGVSSQGEYKSHGCDLEERNSATVFADTLVARLKSHCKATVKYNYKNTHAWEQDMKPGVWTNDSVDDVNLAVFVGHGLAGGSYGVVHNSLHYFTMNSYNEFHPIEMTNKANLGTHEAAWGKVGTSTKWVLSYTCNFLNTSDSYWNKMMQGINICMGFSTKMYIDSRQAAQLGEDWGNGSEIINGFFYGCSLYQSNKIEGGCIARVIFHKSAEHDTIYNYAYATSRPATIEQSPTSYKTLTRVMPGN